MIGMFILGYFSGCVSFFLYGLYSLNKREKAKLKFFNEFKDYIMGERTKRTSVHKRLDQVDEITKQQLEILSTLEMPQRNSIDGRHKQRLNSEIRRLEDDKIIILESILNDGFDPKLVVANEFGERETIPLSTFLKEKKQKAGYNTDTANAPEIKPEFSKAKLSLVKTED